MEWKCNSASVDQYSLICHMLLSSIFQSDLSLLILVFLRMWEYFIYKIILQSYSSPNHINDKQKSTDKQKFMLHDIMHKHINMNISAIRSYKDFIIVLNIYIFVKQEY